MSVDPPYIYDNTYWIYSLTATSLIFILIYSLHAVTKPETFDEIPSNTCGFATSVLTAASSPTSLSPIYTINTAICS